MGQNFCSCSVQYIKGYDDLPDRITEHSTMRKESIVSFKSHKIVTTVTLTPIHRAHHQHHHHHHRHRRTTAKHHKHGHSKKRKKHDRNRQKLRLASIERISLNENEEGSKDITLPAIQLDTLDSLKVNRTFVVYREGMVESQDGATLIPISTITTGSMLEIDIDGMSDILYNKFQLNHIISRCPPKYHCMKWKCLYSLLNHGCSMQTFYGNTQDMEQSMLIIKDQSHNIFGAFLDSKWRAEYHHYTGSRECFVFKFAFENNEYSIFEYHSTGDKPYFVQSDLDGITVGAGESPALYIENNLLMGRTSRCNTFQSDPLSSDNIFEIQNIEIWCPVFE